MIRKFIDSISIQTLGHLAMIPAAIFVYLLWKLLIGPASAVLVCIQTPLLAIQVTALILWIRRIRIGKGQS